MTVSQTPDAVLAQLQTQSSEELSPDLIVTSGGERALRSLVMTIAELREKKILSDDKIRTLAESGRWRDQIVAAACATLVASTEVVPSLWEGVRQATRALPFLVTATFVLDEDFLTHGVETIGAFATREIGERQALQSLTDLMKLMGENQEERLRLPFTRPGHVPIAALSVDWIRRMELAALQAGVRTLSLERSLAVVAAYTGQSGTK